jgi:hypothetical protein
MLTSFNNYSHGVLVNWVLLLHLLQVCSSKQHPLPLRQLLASYVYIEQIVAYKANRKDRTVICDRSRANHLSQ